jgi:carbon storage regulator
MLVFTRRSGEAVIIGDGIEIRVLRVGKDGVRLGIIAPPSLPVHRREVYEQIVAANRSAAAIDPAAAIMAAAAWRVRTRDGGGV